MPRTERKLKMCRSIRPLFNFDPPASDEEIRAASLQFVRKVSGFPRPSRANSEAFDRAVREVSETVRELLDSMVTRAPQRSREREAEKAKQRARRRFSS
jgi:hypothetical protein